MIKFKTIGSDPEFGIKKGELYLPSYMFINGEKNRPEEIENGFFVLKDNLLLEGNIPPSDSKAGFIENMQFLKVIISTILSEKGAEIAEEDIIEYASNFINTEDGKLFGCSSFDHTYSEMSMQAPSNETNSRSLGMHVHVGYDILTSKYDQEDLNYALAKAWDFFATIPSDKIHYCKERRGAYGIAGGFRHTRYGLEFRSLGGFFTQDKYLGWIYDQVQKTIEFVANEDNYKLLQQVNYAGEEYYELLGINLEEQVPTEAKIRQAQLQANL